VHVRGGANALVGDDVDVMALRIERRDLRLTRLVGRADRLLDDHDAQVLQRRSRLDRLQRRPQAVDVEQERVVGADAPAHRLDPPEILG